MRIVGTIAACVGLGAVLGGCSSVDALYIREGIGTSLSSSDLPDVTRVQEIYVGHICHQAGLQVVQNGDIMVCDEPILGSRRWALFVQAGMNDIDRRCDAWLTWLDDKKRWSGPIHQQILDTQTATTAILAATLVNPTKAINVVAGVFGFAAHTFTNVNNRLIFELEKSTIQTVVLTRQQDYRESLRTVPIDNRAAAIYALRQYLRLCMPMTIETHVNTTVKLFERGGPAALANSTPMIDAATVRTAVITDVRAPLPRQEPLRVISPTRLSIVEQAMTPKIIGNIQVALCIPPTREFNPETRLAIHNYLVARNMPPSQIIDSTNDFAIDEAVAKLRVRRGGTCELMKFKNAIEVGKSFAQ